MTATYHFLVLLTARPESQIDEYLAHAEARLTVVRIAQLQIDIFRLAQLQLCQIDFRRAHEIILQAPIIVEDLWGIV